MKIVTILGARPQFIKAAVLSRVIRKRSAIHEIIVHTGQHYDQNMSDIFFEEMEIPKPDYFLDIKSKNHGEMTGRMLEGIEKILIQENPDAVLVYGDTNSTLAGALAASKLHIPIAHVEAGLRSFNRRMPEEINRILTDQLAKWLFVPTTLAITNLRKEGFDQSRIYNVGDIMLDAILYYQNFASSKSKIISDLNLTENEYALVTIHRAENTNDPDRLEKIFSELSLISKTKKIVLPVHPRTRSLLKNDFASQNFKMIDPVGYFDMLQLQKYCRLIITDSGGVQKEAFFNKKYCITVRPETEWMELVENNYNFLVTSDSSIKTLVDELWAKPFPSKGDPLYGDGQTGEKIIQVLESEISAPRGSL
jgi:UDP-GlcNAc3NAcA epimerase